MSTFAKYATAFVALAIVEIATMVGMACLISYAI